MSEDIRDLRWMAHRGDPCIYCSTPYDNVEPGPCPKLVEYADQIKKAEQDAVRSAFDK